MEDRFFLNKVEEVDLALQGSEGYEVLIVSIQCHCGQTLLKLLLHAALIVRDDLGARGGVLRMWGTARSIWAISSQPSSDC